jgi:hypothetical protein
MALGAEAAGNGAHAGAGQAQGLHVRPGPQGPRKTLEQQAHIRRADEGYFDSYGYFDIHRTMLADKVSTGCLAGYE